MPAPRSTGERHAPPITLRMRLIAWDTWLLCSSRARSVRRTARRAPGPSVASERSHHQSLSPRTHSPEECPAYAQHHLLQSVPIYIDCIKRYILVQSHPKGQPSNLIKSPGRGVSSQCTLHVTQVRTCQATWAFIACFEGHPNLASIVSCTAPLAACGIATHLSVGWHDGNACYRCEGVWE